MMVSVMNKEELERAADRINEAMCALNDLEEIIHMGDSSLDGPTLSAETIIWAVKKMETIREALATINPDAAKALAERIDRGSD